MSPLQRAIGGCESSGDPAGPLRNVPNAGGSTASGPWQVLDSTWRSWRRAYGADLGAEQYARAMHAPVDVQREVVARALAAQGTRPWAASRGCWA